MASSNKHLHITLDERKIIETGIFNGSTRTAIARTIGKDKSTVGREIDKSALNEAIAAAEALDGEDYTTNSWNVLTSALETAKTVAADDNAAQTEIDDAANALNGAKAALQVKASKAAIDALQNVVDKANALQEASLAELIAAAQALLDDPTNASVTAVVSAMLDLSEAMADLNTGESEDVLRADVQATIDFIKEHILNNVEGLRPGKVQALKDAVAAAEELLATSGRNRR